MPWKICWKMGMAVKLGMSHPPNFIELLFNDGKNFLKSLGEIDLPIKALFKVA
jgi:hypothetical protein